MDPLNYFLVILGGFGVVWGFRTFGGTGRKSISEFEYAAFSALWGIPVFFIFTSALKSRPDLLNGIFDLPMSGTPILFGMGLVMGAVGAELRRIGFAIRSYFKSREK